MLRSEGDPGRIFEVTPRQEIIWEYISQMPGRNVARGMPNTPESVFRAHRYAPDHPGFPGERFGPGPLRRVAVRWQIAQWGQDWSVGVELAMVGDPIAISIAFRKS